MGSYGSGSKPSYDERESYGNRQSTSSYSGLRNIISLMEEVGKKADKVSLKESELESARRELGTAKLRLESALANLDLQTKEMLTTLTNSLNNGGKIR